PGTPTGCGWTGWRRSSRRRGRWPSSATGPRSMTARRSGSGMSPARRTGSSSSWRTSSGAEPGRSALPHPDVGRPVRAIVHVDGPGLAAHRTILDVLLHRPAAGVEDNAGRHAAVGAGDRGLEIGDAVAEGELLIQ